MYKMQIKTINEHVGYYYTEALCDECIKKDLVKCSKCEKEFGYLCWGQMGSRTRGDAIIWCHDCARK